jgi:hypothetical protein
MDVQAIFGLSVLMSFIAFGIVARLYIWPALQRMDLESALVPLIVPHITRFAGLSFLVPGVVSPELPQAFAVPAAWGDLIAAVLGMIALLALHWRAAWAIVAVWIFNVWGTADFLVAYYQGLIGAPFQAGLLGGAFFIPAAIVPALFGLHVMIFVLLLRHD